MDGAERLLLVAIAALGAACLLRLARGAGRLRWVLAGVVVYAAVVAALVVPRSHAQAAAALPARTSEGGFVGSEACRSCHPAEHASWHESFHRTMTREASAKTVLAPVDGIRLEDAGATYELERRGNEVWATLADPEILATVTRGERGRSAASRVPAVQRRVVLTTGSHHYQAYWVDGGEGNELRLFPFVYLLEDKRFVPRRDAFLQPPDAPDHAPRWNASCIQCHSVAGRPGHDAKRDVFESRVAELGIACEACHGPGSAHVAKHHNPWSRYRQRLSDAPDDSIVNPARLDAERASEVCGQCHAYFVPRREEQWWDSGFAHAFRPGARLAESRVVLDYAERGSQTALVEASFDSMFWADGTIRIGGREHNGLLRSACFERGHGKQQLSCLSCHSMHRSKPDDQLAQDMDGNAACVRCHEDIGARVSAHTHHAEGSAGSLCYGCHMPHTSYALLKAVRSHRIDSPNAAVALATGRPDACSLCHVDRPLRWTANKLREWYGQVPLEVPAESREVSAVVSWLLSGDAAKRVVAAYAVGRPEAQRASGADWQAPLLARLLDDPYSAVRYVAARSLRSLSGFSSFEYDFVGAPSERRAAVDRATRLWQAKPAGRRDSALLLDAQGRLDRAALEAWLARRDERAVTIAE